MFSIPRRIRFCLFDSPCHRTHYLLFPYDMTNCLRACSLFPSPYVNLIHDETRLSIYSHRIDRRQASTTTNYLISYVTNCSDGSTCYQILQHHPTPAEKGTISSHQNVRLSLLCILFHSTLLIGNSKPVEFICTICPQYRFLRQHTHTHTRRSSPFKSVCVLF